MHAIQRSASSQLGPGYSECGPHGGIAEAEEEGHGGLKGGVSLLSHGASLLRPGHSSQAYVSSYIICACVVIRVCIVIYVYSQRNIRIAISVCSHTYCHVYH